MARTWCYPSDLTDDEWALVERLLPRAGSGGRPGKHSRREVVDAVLEVVRTGCAWRQLPADFPPWQTVYWYFVRWEKQRVTLRMLDVLRQQVRRAEADRWTEESAAMPVVVHLTAEEGEEISRGVAAGMSGRAIARGLGRPVSTVSREIARNGGTSASSPTLRGLHREVTAFSNVTDTNAAGCRSSYGTVGLHVRVGRRRASGRGGGRSFRGCR
uniref:transposase n=1 Tax=Actinomadura sp. CA-154981 TaxID=3240037 RepID=UPI003F492A26